MVSLPDPARWSRLSPLLDALLDLPLADRAAGLAAMQQAAPDLADELARLLDDSGQAQSHGFLAGAVPAPGSAADTSLAGHRLGAYVLEAPLGQGGGGSVWRARREDGRFDGAVAIKLLHLSLVGRAGAERFKREGQILARLTHPHIAHLLDAGVTAGGQPYLVLELVQGQRIDQHCDQRQLGNPARLALFGDVLDAVAHAHTHGVIHRDLKPGNILVTDAGQVKLLDFGIAKLLADEADSADATALTRDGGRALTPDYAAPEQLRGDGVTTATDVYALGVLLHQLLTGRHPTAAAGAGAAEVMRATLEVQPLRPSRSVLLPQPTPAGVVDTPADGATPATTDLAAQRNSTPQRLARALQGDLDTIVLRTLGKLPAERYPTVVALAEDLRRHRAHQPVLARPDALGYRVAKFVRRHRGAVAAGALVGLATVVGVAGTVWQARQAQQQRLIAEHQKTLAEQQAQRALDESDLASAMSRLVSVALGPVSDKPVLVADVLTRGQAIAERQFASTPRVQAHLLRQLGVMWAEGGDWARTHALLQASRAAALRAGDALQVAEADCVLAIVAVYQGDFIQADTLVAAGLAVARASTSTSTSTSTSASASTGNHRATLIECLSNRSSIADAQRRYPAALADLDEALQWLGTPRIGEQDTLFDLRIKRAAVLGSAGDMARAVAEYDSVLQALQQRGELDITAYNPVLNNFANLLLRAGQVRRADEVLRLLLARQQGPGAGRPREPAEAVNQAMVLVQLGRTAEAVALIDSTLAQATVQASPYLQVRATIAAAEARCAAGDVARCAAHASQLARLVAAKPDDNTELRARLALVGGHLALLQGQTASATAHAGAGLAATAAPGGNPSRRVAAWLLAADVALAQGQPALAGQHAAQAVAEARQKFAGFAQSRPLGLALLAQGQAALAAGNAGAARTHWQAAVQQLDAALGPDAADARSARQRLAGLGGVVPAR